MKTNALPWKDFLAEREEVLRAWPTGRGITLEDGIRFQSKIPKEKNFALAMRRAREAGKTLTQPRAGVALVDQHIQLLRYLESEGGADVRKALMDEEICSGLI